MDELVVAVELAPGGGVITVTLRPGEARSVPLATPVVGPGGVQYTAVEIAVARV